MKHIISDLSGTIAHIKLDEQLIESVGTIGPKYLETVLTSPTQTEVKAQAMRVVGVTGFYLGDALARDLEKVAREGEPTQDQLNLIFLIAEEACRQGRVQAKIFPDVVPAVQKWNEYNIPVSVYSNASMRLQQVALQKTNLGNITNLFDLYIDPTVVGSKKEAESYHKMSRMLGTDSSELLFLSDSQKEVHAAAEAGYHVRLVKRPGNPPITTTYPTVNSFSEVEW